jgi:hypothetical protein
MLLALAVQLMLVPAGHTHDDNAQRKCLQTKDKIRKIESRMRQGYSARQGIRMDEKLRRLKKQRSKHCR